MLYCDFDNCVIEDLKTRSWIVRYEGVIQDVTFKKKGQAMSYLAKLQKRNAKEKFLA